MFSGIQSFFQKLFYTQSPLDTIVPIIVSKTAGLELVKDEYVFLAPPSESVYGSVSLTGNSLPTFHYTVFDPSLMDFVLVRMEVSLPARVDFIAKLIPTQAERIEGRPMYETNPDLVQIPTKPSYVEPGTTLLKHLASYFPLIKAGT